MITSLSNAILNDVLFVAQPCGGQAQFAPQVAQVYATHVAQFYPFQITPDAFVRVQFRGVARQLLQLQPLAGTVSQEGFDDLTAMNRRAVPDHQHLAGKMTQHVLQKTDHIRAAEGPLLDLKEQLSVHGDAADDRQMLPLQKYPQDRRPATRCIGTHHARQQREAGLVYPDDGPPFGLGLSLRAGHRSLYQAAMAASSRWVARRIGFWALQPMALRT